MGFLDKLVASFMEKNRDGVLTAMEKVNSGGGVDDVETLTRTGR